MFADERDRIGAFYKKEMIEEYERILMLNFESPTALREELENTFSKKLEKNGYTEGHKKVLRDVTIPLFREIKRKSAPETCAEIDKVIENINALVPGPLVIEPDLPFANSTAQKTGRSFAGVVGLFLIICCPPAWPFAIMMLIFGGISGRYQKPPRR